MMLVGDIRIDAFRVDAILTDPEGNVLAPICVGGITLSEAITASIVITAPHVAAGMGVMVVRAGEFCERCNEYHEIVGAEITHEMTRVREFQEAVN